MAPPKRRSLRLKRQADSASAQPGPVSEPLPCQVSSAPPPAKKRKNASSSALLTNVPDSSPCDSYKQTKATLFLGADFESVHWVPRESTERDKKTDMVNALRAEGNDVHNYFSSRQAAEKAAGRKVTESMYRHIGHVMIRDFHIRKSSVNHVRMHVGDEVNLLHAIREGTGSDESTLNAFYSLAEIHQEPYSAPYVVFLTDSDSFFSHAELDSGHLKAQVYIGRLAFEMIGLKDMKLLFDALVPSEPFQPLPRVRQYPAVLGHSPAPAYDDRFTLSGVLRRAESAGYAMLSNVQREKVGKHLSVKLYPFQEQTVRWMLDKENNKYCLNDYFWEERFFSSFGHGKRDPFYYFPRAGEVRLKKPPVTRGGMVTEEMGLGKTVEALALIAAKKKLNRPEELDVHCESRPVVLNGHVSARKLRQKNQDYHSKQPCPLHHGDEVLKGNVEGPYPQTFRVRRFPPQTTLVLCPNSLLTQWVQEVRRRAPGLTFAVWSPSTPREKGTDCNVAVGRDAKDIVLATYSSMGKCSMLSRISWKRLILDEAQVTRVSSARVARDTYNLRSQTRFLMTGTPIVNHLQDLQGELAFLKIWPFTLTQDGFWETFVMKPFVNQTETSFLDQLLNITMMRHTKGQRLLLTLPSRSYETIEVELTSSHRAIYCFVLCSCLQELALWNSSAHPRQLRTLLRLLLSTCISPSLLNLTALDLARRNMWGRSQGHGGGGHGSAEGFMLKKLSAFEAIQFLSEAGSGIAGNSNRRRALLRAPAPDDLERILIANANDSSATAEDKLPFQDDRDLVRERLMRLGAGDARVLAGMSGEALRQMIARLCFAGSRGAGSMPKSRAIALLAKYYSTKASAFISDSIHEAGFTALTKLIEENESPGCPICLQASIEKISLTKCGHFYCVECIQAVFENSKDRIVKCAICRRDVRLGSVVAVERPGPAKTNGCCARAEDEGFQNKNEKLSASSMMQSMTFVLQADSQRYAHAARPTLAEAQAEYEELESSSYSCPDVHRDPEIPSIDLELLRHMAAIRAGDAAPPKLFALRSLIRSCGEEVKFCVVADTIQSLRGIGSWLTDNGIKCVGVTSRGWSGNSSSSGIIVKQFSDDPSVRVFLLNTASSTGLTLTAAQYVVFMESMVRITDEMQAAARVHRIGQTRPVKIIRIVAKNTIEEQIIFQRGGLASAADETEALLGVGTKEAPVKDLIRLFRDLSPQEEAL